MWFLACWQCGKKSWDLPQSEQEYQEVATFFQVDSELVIRSELDSTATGALSLSSRHLFYEEANHNLEEPANAQTKARRYTWNDTIQSRLKKKALEREGPSVKHISVPFNP